MRLPAREIRVQSDALFIDVDGTLLEFRPDPDEVVADAGLLKDLVRLRAAAGDAIALVSGRSIASLDRIFAPYRFIAAGTHGAELRLDTSDRTEGIRQPLDTTAIASLQRFAQTDERLLLEVKPSGASLHYRRAPELESACRAAVDLVLQQKPEGLRLIEGNHVLELAAAGHDKGLAIRSLMTAVPFAARRPVFFGDDVTDEDGFRAVNDLGGISVLIGERSPTEARFRLADVAAMRGFINELVAPTA